ncbi:DsbC family protein [Thiomicrorhabdus lithotrophica]|uniref:Thiol:disulfide interchange protein n=1 Tax=Thiomicrorhabdus lithotrophica TaxID=2949997 RepID=A0ABY8CB60_9GAMM|nr:DsbC family protein [Thiomicrorhabdus lithotrophica]WEJ63220.1 DsbC family protein [Thiomicrorhabdus lithotrophica]
MIRTIQKKFLVSLVSSAMLLTAAPMIQAADDTSAIQKRLQTIIPNDAQNAQITSTPVPGLYQIQIGMTVVYMSKDGQYLVNGNVVNLETNQNLTKEAKAKTRKLALSKISEKGMIVYPAKGGKDNAKHTITVFTDIDCPYCAKLHKEIPALNDAGVNVRYLAYPRSGMGSPSYFKAVSVWCAKDPVKSMDDAMVGLPPENKQCQNPVRDHMMQAEVFEVNGTPNIILDNGDLLPGYVPAKELIKLLKSS